MIDRKWLVSKGDVAKYKIQITHADFTQDTDNYRVELTWGMFRRAVTIGKAEMTTDEDGNVFLIFDTSDMLGWVKAVCHYDVEDSDAQYGYREEVNYQWLCFVTESPITRFCGEPENGGDGHVVYTRVYGSDVNTARLNLRDSDKRNLLDSNGEQIRVHKTPEDYQDK